MLIREERADLCGIAALGGDCQRRLAAYDRTKAEILELAQLKYSRCAYSDTPQKTAVLRDILGCREQLNTLDTGLLKSCAARIFVSHFCTVEVELINGVTIKNTTERSNFT